MPKVKENNADTKEVWKPIKGFDKYEVSNKGRVKSYHKKEPNILTNILSGSGYYQVHLFSDKRKIQYIHRLVAEAFIPNPEDKPQVNHIDENKKNNNVDNLEWVTGSENHRHSFPVNHGETHPRSTLSNIDALEIRNRVASVR